MKNVFWNEALCRSWVNRRFGGLYGLHIQGKKIRERGTSVYSHLPHGVSLTWIILLSYKYVCVYICVCTYILCEILYSCQSVTDRGLTAGTEGEAPVMFQETGGSVLVERIEGKIFRYPEMQPLNVTFNIPLGWGGFVGMVMYSFHVYQLNVICQRFSFHMFPADTKRSTYASRVTTWCCMGRWMIRVCSFYYDMSTVCPMYSWDVVATWMINHTHMVFHLKYWG
jgi:hypothetical protein